MRDLFGFLVLLLIGALLAGAVLGNSELINPSESRAKVDKLKAEAEAIRAQTAYEEQKRQLELMVKEEKAELELQALRERAASRQQREEWLILAGLFAGSMLATSVAVSLLIYSVAKARAFSGGKGGPGLDPAQLPIDRANVSPWRATYDGLLAYCYDFYLGPNGTILFYARGISREVVEFYLSVLQQARIITAGDDGHSWWTLRPCITCLDDIRQRISPEAFDQLARRRGVPEGEGPPTPSGG